MRLAIFGGTSLAGQALIVKALAAGYSISALVDNTETADWRIQHKRLTVTIGNILDTRAVAETLTHADASVGILHNEAETKSVLMPGLQNIVDAMQRQHIKRLVLCLDVTTENLTTTINPPKKTFRSLLQGLLGRPTLLGSNPLQVVQDSGLDWTIIHSSQPYDGPQTNTLTVGLIDEITSRPVSHADLAKFMLSQVTDAGYLYQMRAVSS